MHIREAVVTDCELLATLNGSVQNLHRLGKPQFFREATPGARDWFAALIGGGRAWAWVAEVDGAPVGYALAVLRERNETPFTLSSRSLELDQIAVLPSHRRGGIARALVERVRQRASELGLSELTLKCWSFNSAAQVAFAHLGFAQEVVQYTKAVEPATEHRPS